MPGTKAFNQGQVFMVSCLNCNGWVEDNAKEARRLGLVKSNPMKRKDNRRYQDGSN